MAHIVYDPRHTVTEPYDYVSRKEYVTAQKQIIYDELSRVLTNYECGEYSEKDLYEMLVKIQNRWEDTITAEDN